MKRIAFAAILLGIFALTVSSPAEAFQSELERYQHAINPKICSMGITPEIVRLYEAAVNAMDRANVGLGNDSNFAGPIPPDVALTNCVTAGGD